MDHEIKYVKSITRKYEGFYFKPKGILQQVFASFDKYYLIFEHPFPIKNCTIMYIVNGFVSFPFESVKKKRIPTLDLILKDNFEDLNNYF